MPEAICLMRVAVVRIVSNAITIVVVPCQKTCIKLKLKNPLEHLTTVCVFAMSTTYDR